MSPSRCRPSAARPRRRIDLAHRLPEVAQHRHPTPGDVPHARRHRPPGRVTRAISLTPRSGSRMKPMTSEDSAASKRRVGPRAAPRPRPRGRRRRDALTASGRELGAGSIAATFSPPTRAATSAASPPGPQPTSTTRMPARHPRRIGQRHRQCGRVAPHETVVVVGRPPELHRPTEPNRDAPVKAAMSGGRRAPRPPQTRALHGHACKFIEQSRARTDTRAIAPGPNICSPTLGACATVRRGARE